MSASVIGQANLANHRRGEQTRKSKKEIPFIEVEQTRKETKEYHYRGGRNEEKQQENASIGAG